MLRAALVLALLAGCVVGAPPGFSDGDRWTAPLVAPLEGGRLLVPVTIQGTGPYLFVIDPDSDVSAIDSSIQRRLKLYTVGGPEQLSEADKRVPIFLSEVKQLSLGTLTVRNRKLRVFDEGTFWEDGRRIQGILGRDIIAASLVLAVDRDRGLVHLATHGNQPPPAGAAEVSFSRFNGRAVAEAVINQRHQVALHLDLGARHTLLWPARMDQLKLPRLAVQATLRDEFGSERAVSRGAMLAMLEVGGERENAILALPYADQRVREHELDGVVGQDFFAAFHVTADWHGKRFWLLRRTADLRATAAERIGRWGDDFAACPTPGCVTVSVAGGAGPAAAPPAAPEAAEPAAPGAAPAAAPSAAPAPGAASAAAPSAAPAPGAAPPAAPSAAPGAAPAAVTLRVERAAPTLGFAYDVLLEAVDASGQPLGLPRLAATLPEGMASISQPDLDPAYAGAASFVVLDVNRVGSRTCAASGCVFPLSSPL